MRIGLLLFSLFLFSSFTGQAQLYKKYTDHADELMQIGDHQAAVLYYKKALYLDSSDSKLNFKLATAYRYTNDYEMSLHYYSRCSKMDRSASAALALHYAGEMEKIVGSFRGSLKWHRKFIKRFKGDRKAYEYIKSQHELAKIRQVSRIISDSAGIVLNNAYEVNTVSSEFSPFFTSNSRLLFSSLRSDSTKGIKVIDTSVYYSRVFVSEDDNGWTKGKSHLAFIDSEKIHIANVIHSPKSDYAYYSECDKPGNCKLFRARIIDGNWSNFEELPEKINLTSTNNTQPIMARIDGFDILFYASDRKGGYGKMDIWYCVAFSNGLFGDPVNLGDSVNSPGNEICPFYLEEENALYFSSDFHYGLGGFDVFRCINLKDRYSSPENMGIPINSTYNDLYFRHRKGKAVISSNRIGSKTDKHQNCCNDLFFFDYEAKEIKPEAELSNMERIQRLLPIRMFFDNDQPNPRSMDTSTTMLYSASHIAYVSRLPLYKKEYGKGLKAKSKEAAGEEIQDFFEYEVEPAFEDFKEVLNLLETELKKGKKIRIDIKGFASPLSNAKYNRNLTLRRISSVRNELHHFNRGVLQPYLDSGQLKVRPFPFGEDRASSHVSDDLNDKRNAIYSKRAAFERRVEIIGVEGF